MSDYDIVVVGASIAGCTTATFLGRAGARVALLESHSDPRTFKRMCTHFIQPSASPTIERLGLTGPIERAGGRRNDLNIWTRYGWISHSREWSEPPMRDYPAWNIRRETLDPIVREHAAATAGVTLMLGHTATAVSREDGAAGGEGGRVNGVKVRERDGSEHALRARLVVAADGRDSQIAKLAGVPAKIKPNNRFGYFAHYRDTPLVTGDSAQMWLLNPDVAYAFPTDASLTLLTCMPHKDRLAEFKSDPERAMVRLFEGLPDGPRLDPAKRESKVMGKLDMPNSMRTASTAGLAFVGDAALSADPLWGVGCGWAFQSGEWLADAVAPALARGEAEVDRALQRYAREHRERLEAHEKLCSAYSRGRRFNPLERLLYRAAARDRTIADRVSQMGGRWIRPQEMLTAGTLARILRVNLNPSSSQNGLLRGPPVSAPPASVSTVS
jgi:flavin-dependent dehydrogenase